MAEGQSDAAAERSAHVIRGGDDRDSKADRCFVCGGPWGKGNASAGARVLPKHGLVQVCSPACYEDPNFAGEALPPAEVMALRLELEALRQENTALKEALAALSGPPTEKATP